MKALAHIPFAASIILSMCVMAGCQSGMIRADAVDGAFRRVAERHDRYVPADAALSPLEKSISLRDTALIRAVLDAAKSASAPVK